MKTNRFFLGCCLFIGGVLGMQAQTFQGSGAGTSSTSTSASGFGENTLSSGNTGNYNTAVGINALKSNTSGVSNTAVGGKSLEANSTGERNAAFGYLALAVNTQSYNSAFGANALAANTIGSRNSAVGTLSLALNVSGNENTAMGFDALNANTASQNSAFGAEALASNVGGTGNTGMGYKALWKNQGGQFNTAIGNSALTVHANGSYNTALAYYALYSLNTGDNNTAIGANAGRLLTQGSGNTLLGTSAGEFMTTGSQNTFVGYVKFPTSTSISNTIALADGGGTTRIFSTSAGTSINLGNTAATATLDVNGGARFRSLPTSTTNTMILSVDTSGGATDGVISKQLPINLYNSHGILAADRYVDMNDNRLVFDTQSSGRVYIGNTEDLLVSPFTSPFNIGNFPALSAPDSNYRLLVEGGILTEKVKVALRNGTPNNWADYVFAEGYKLMPLKEVESFIKENKHLPGIESADELQKNGLDLADMQRKQMEKIEELTLHLIGQGKTIEQQNAQIEELKAQVKVLLENKKN